MRGFSLSICIVLAGCSTDITVTPAPSGACYRSSSSANVLCALNVSVDLTGVELATGDVSIVTTDLLLNTYHIDDVVGFSGVLTTQDVAKNGPLCGDYDDRLAGNGCPLIHNGVACVGTQTTIAVFDGGPMGTQLASVEVDVPMSCN